MYRTIRPMDLKKDLIDQASAYCEIARISKARLATIVANDGKFFDRIARGGSFTVAMYQRFQDYMRDNPADTRVRGGPHAPRSRVA